MTITADTDCKIKINGKELAPLKAGVPFTYKGHWGDNTVDAELMDKSDHFSEKIFVDADKFTYMVRFVKPEKLLKFINENKIDMVKEVLKNNPTVVNPKDEFEFSPLALACEKGKTEIVQIMLDNGADLKLAGNAQCLLNASMNGHTEIARLLIDKGMNINQKFENNWTLLHHATQKGKMDIISLLLEKGVDVTAKNDKGETAKDIAYENGMIELARMLGN
jgi:ankyrin repeat protein